MHFLRAIRPLLSDFLSTIFFVVLYALTHNIYVSVVVGMAVGAAQIVYLRASKQPIDLMQWASLALVVVLGSATMLTRDARFVMVKPSIGAAAIATVMLRRDWMARYLPPIVTENIAPGLIRVFGRLWSGLLFLLAAGNLYFALAMSQEAWAWFASVVPLAAQLGLFAVQYLLFRTLISRRIRARIAAGDTELLKQFSGRGMAARF